MSTALFFPAVPQDFANPLVRKDLTLYPEITNTVAEVWQAEKYLKEIDIDGLSPMWANWAQAPNNHFYVKEIAQRRDGDYVLALKWVIYQQQVHVEAYWISQEQPSGIFALEDHETIRFPATDLAKNYLEISCSVHVQFFGDTSPGPKHPIAGGRPVFVVRIIPWADDVSGNRSKQYNAHQNVYLANANLPFKNLMQEYNIRFCSTSPDASAVELLEAVARDCQDGAWNIAYDSLLKQEILFWLGVHFWPADNPQQAKITSTMGSIPNAWCRQDKGGGSKSHRESNEGYHALYSPGPPRMASETVNQITKQIQMACRGVMANVEALQTESGIKDKITQHWTPILVAKAKSIQKIRVITPATRDQRLSDLKIKGEAREVIKSSIIMEIEEEVFRWFLTQPPDRYQLLSDKTRSALKLRAGDHFNAVLQITGAIAQHDTPPEILHTILLGNDKYIWHKTSKKWSDDEGSLFAHRLQAASVDGLTIPALKSHYMIKYKNSLIGKHLKSLQQLSIFQLDSQLCSGELFDLWNAAGHLGALLWYPEIRDMDQYSTTCWIAGPVLIPAESRINTNSTFSPICRKPFVDLAQRRVFATEIFECWNAIFRFCSILSNHQAPSRDIANTLADMERFKHQVSGGWWKDSGVENDRDFDGLDNEPAAHATEFTGKKWTRAGPQVLQFMKKNRQLQRRLGWTQEVHEKPGSCKPVSKNKRHPELWTIIVCQVVVDFNCDWVSVIEPDETSPRLTWTDCKYVVAKSTDLCFVGPWIFYSDSDDPKAPASVARIVRILTLTTDVGAREPRIALIVQMFFISGTSDQKFKMPLSIAQLPAEPHPVDSVGRDTPISGPQSCTKIISVSVSCPNQIDCFILILCIQKGILFKFNAQHDCQNLLCAIETRPDPDQRTGSRKVLVHKETSRFLINMHALHNVHLLREMLPRHLTMPERYYTEIEACIAAQDEAAAVLQKIGPEKCAQATARSQATREKNSRKRKGGEVATEDTEGIGGVTAAGNNESNNSAQAAVAMEGLAD
ncbi:unnamed protein product [Mycena citricolor]|uniref:Uncharacterized protein n=1 Tax=Mycena citricolor TaxID=2018698 RepID=A0AAD2JV90_9AGAR|nr:unnamed protein product [Mycena citricolor]